MATKLPPELLEGEDELGAVANVASQGSDSLLDAARQKVREVNEEAEDDNIPDAPEGIDGVEDMEDDDSDIRIPVPILATIWFAKNSEPPTEEEADEFEDAVIDAVLDEEEEFEFEGKVYETTKDAENEIEEDSREGRAFGGVMRQRYSFGKFVKKSFKKLRKRTKRAHRLGKKIAKRSHKLGKKAARRAHRLGLRAAKRGHSLGKEAASRGHALGKEAASRGHALGKEAASRGHRVGKTVGKGGWKVAKEMDSRGRDFSKKVGKAGLAAGLMAGSAGIMAGEMDNHPVWGKKGRIVLDPREWETRPNRRRYKGGLKNLSRFFGKFRKNAAKQRRKPRGGIFGKILRAQEAQKNKMRGPRLKGRRLFQMDQRKPKGGGLMGGLLRRLYEKRQAGVPANPTAAQESLLGGQGQQQRRRGEIQPQPFPHGNVGPFSDEVKSRGTGIDPKTGLPWGHGEVAPVPAEPANPYANYQAAASRYGFAEGSLLSGPEDTYDNIPEDEKAAAEASQLPDNIMEERHQEYVLDEALDDDEKEYLLEAMEEDEELESIVDQLIEVATEFSGSGSVEGQGTGVSDSIPARLSDGEFVITAKAVKQIGVQKLQKMMDQAEREADKNGITND